MCFYIIEAGAWRGSELIFINFGPLWISRYPVYPSVRLDQDFENLLYIRNSIPIFPVGLLMVLKSEWAHFGRRVVSPNREERS